VSDRAGLYGVCALSDTADKVTPLSRSIFIVLFLGLCVTAAGNTALQTVLPAVSRELKIPDILVGLAFSFSALLWTLSAPFWANRAERHGRRALMEIGLIGFIASMLFGGISLLIGLRGIVTPIMAIALFTFFRCSYGLLGSAAIPAAQAYVATRTSGAERTSALSKLSASFGIGTIIGPALAPFLIIPFLALSGPLFCFALIGIATLAAVRRIMPADAPDGAARILMKPLQKISWLDPRVFPFIVFAFLVGHAQAIILQTIGFVVIDAMKLKPADAQPFIGLAIMAGAATTVLAQWGIIPNFKLSPRQLLRWGCLISLLGAGLTAVALNYANIIIGFAVMSLGFGMIRPGFTAGASLAVRRNEQDAVAGAITSVNGSCYIIAPSIGIALYHWHNHAPFYACAGITVTLLAYGFFNPVLRTVQDEAPDADEIAPAFEQ
jgi:MFS family permease